MEYAESEVDTVDGDEAVALFAKTGNREGVESEVFEFSDRPGGEHDPAEDRVDEEDKGIGDTGGGTGWWRMLGSQT